MRAMRSRAMAGGAVASLTMTYLSPMITPEFGSPSAVYAQQWALSCSKVIFLSARSAWLANALDTAAPVKPDRPVLTELGQPCDGDACHPVHRQAGIDLHDPRLARGVFERRKLAGHEAGRHEMAGARGDAALGLLD